MAYRQTIAPTSKNLVGGLSTRALLVKTARRLLASGETEALALVRAALRKIAQIEARLEEEYRDE